MRIVSTGGAGTGGRRVVAELKPDHELRLRDRRGGDPGILAGDLGRPLSGDLFRDVDVVVHLAANPDERAAWGAVLNDNVRATWHVLDAAAVQSLPRLVFASSTWAVKATEYELAPACYRPDGPKIGSDAPPRPLGPYGISKALGEIAARSFVDEGRLTSVLAVRIGSYGPDVPGVDEHPLWIGRSDLRALFRRCVEAEVRGFHVVYGMSAQETAPYDLTHTSELLGWQPRQRPGGSS